MNKELNDSLNKELEMLQDLIDLEKDFNNLHLPKLNELKPFMQAFVKIEQDNLEKNIKENNHKFKEKDCRYFMDLNKSKSKNTNLLIEGNKDKIRSPIGFR